MTKEEIQAKIDEKEAQLDRAKRERDAWNTGKNKTHLNADLSQKYVEALQKEISELHVLFATIIL